MQQKLNLALSFFQLMMELDANIYHLPTISHEQRAIVDAILEGNNVVVDSVAGSGKTTTVLYIAKLTKLKVLLLTYNARLKLETRAKATEFKLDNLEVHSYHSFACRYYRTNAGTDYLMNSVIGESPRIKPTFDLVVIDEAQDMIPLYYNLVLQSFTENVKQDNVYLDDVSLDDSNSTSVTKDRTPHSISSCGSGTPPRWCIIGDKHQNIYKFNGANEKYIIQAETLFPSDNNWFRLNLSITYRLTPTIAGFINDCLLRNSRLKAIKSGENDPVQYIFANPFHACKKNGIIYKLILSRIRSRKSDNIFILAPSVRFGKKNPLSKLVNELSIAGVNIFVPTNDESRPDEDVMRGKLVFLTFHQAKGLERDVVIIFNFDDSYYKYFNKSANPHRCPNEIYVAATRAKEELILIHSSGIDYLPFFNENALEKYATITGPIQKKKKNTSGYFQTIPEEIAVTELTRYVPIEILIECCKYFICTPIRPANGKIPIPDKVKFDNNYEDVSDLNGLAIPALFETMNRKSCSVQKFLNREPVTKASDLLEMCNEYLAKTTGYSHRLRQISRYDWLDCTNVKRCIVRMREFIGKNAEFEASSARNIDIDNFGTVTLNGRVDCLDDGTLWEFKCTSELHHEHQIQLAIYSYIRPNMKHYKLFNILTGEIIEISGKKEQLAAMIRLLIKTKYQ